jgi:hypothetical protein
VEGTLDPCRFIQDTQIEICLCPSFVLGITKIFHYRELRRNINFSAGEINNMKISSQDYGAEM